MGMKVSECVSFQVVLTLEVIEADGCTYVVGDGVAACHFGLEGWVESLTEHSQKCCIPLTLSSQGAEFYSGLCG